MIDIHETSLNWVKQIEEELQELFKTEDFNDYVFISGHLPLGLIGKPIRHFIFKIKVYDEEKKISERWLIKKSILEEYQQRNK